MNKTLIIAEVGDAHYGILDKALKLVEQAKWADADLVKFQMWIDIDRFIAKTNPYYQEFKDSRLKLAEWEKVFNRAKELDIECFASVWTLKTVDFLESLGVKRYKVGSGDITYKPLLEKLNGIKKPVIVSVGMATPTEILDAYFILKDIKDFTLMKCSVDYPKLMPQDANIAGITTLKNLCKTVGRRKVKIGYSDHYRAGPASFLAVARGAEVIEKHLSLDGVEAASPSEFRSMVRAIRIVETMLGSDDLKTFRFEEKWKKIARRNPETWLRE